MARRKVRSVTVALLTKRVTGLEAQMIRLKRQCKRCKGGDDETQAIGFRVEDNQDPDGDEDIDRREVCGGRKRPV